MVPPFAFSSLCVYGFAIPPLSGGRVPVSGAGLAVASGDLSLISALSAQRSPTCSSATFVGLGTNATGCLPGLFTSPALPGSPPSVSSTG